MIASDVTDLPQPDSPTRPTVWPAWTSKETPSTAVNGSSPWRVKVTLRSSTDSSGAPLPAPPVLRVGGRGGHAGHLRDFGSRASRSDSPISVKPSATTMMHAAG